MLMPLFDKYSNMSQASLHNDIFIESEILIPVLCGSGSGSVGSVCFGPWSGSRPVSQRYESWSFYHQAIVRKIIVRKTLIPNVWWPLFDFLSLKNDVNVPSKSNMQKKLEKLVFCCDENSRIRRHGSLDPDPYQNIMDPQHWLILICFRLRDVSFSPLATRGLLREVVFSWRHILCPELWRQAKSPVPILVAQALPGCHCDGSRHINCKQNWTCQKNFSVFF